MREEESYRKEENVSMNVSDAQLFLQRFLWNIWLVILFLRVIQLVPSSRVNIQLRKYFIVKDNIK